MKTSIQRGRFISSLRRIEPMVLVWRSQERRRSCHERTSHPLRYGSKLSPARAVRCGAVRPVLAHRPYLKCSPHGLEGRYTKRYSFSYGREMNTISYHLQMEVADYFRALLDFGPLRRKAEEGGAHGYIGYRPPWWVHRSLSHALSKTWNTAVAQARRWLRMLGICRTL